MTQREGAYRDPGRKTPAAGAHTFLGQPNVFFVTANAKDRVPWIGQPLVQTTLVEIWREVATAWLVGYYLLMPDHLHLFCAPRDLHFGIDSWIMFWESQFTKRHPDKLWAWQRRAFHHRMRDRIEYEDKLRYVQENPVRHNLVKGPEHWPLQGRVYDLVWTGD